MLYTRDKFRIPAEITIEVIPLERLDLARVEKEIHQTVHHRVTNLIDRTACHDDEDRPDPDYLAALESHCAISHYKAYPNPFERLAAELKLQLTFHDTEEERQNSFWPPFLKTLRVCLAKLSQPIETGIPLDAFRDLFELRLRYIDEWNHRNRTNNHSVDFPPSTITASLEDAMPVYGDTWNYRDVKARVEPADPEMRRLLHKLSWFEFMCQPGPKLYLNGVPQPYPPKPQRTHTHTGKPYTTQAELHQVRDSTRQAAIDQATALHAAALLQAEARLSILPDPQTPTTTPHERKVHRQTTAQINHCQAVLNSLKTTQEPT